MKIANFILVLITIAIASFASPMLKLFLPNAMDTMGSYPTHSHLKLGEWAPPGPGDARSPCPALNTLANHGFLPRDGYNITRTKLLYALQNVYNLSSVLANILTFAGILQDGHDSMVSLAELRTHNTIEHDASMTRLDFYFGDNYDLNQGLYAGLLSASADGVVLTSDDFAAYQSRRRNDSLHNNPTFTNGAKQKLILLGEPQLFMAVFGQTDGSSYNVSLENVKSVFGHEMLPIDWNGAPTEVTFVQVLGMTLK